MSDKAEKKMITDVFVEGARRGWAIATNSVIPNVIMAFVIIYILNLTGLLAIIGNVFAPVMAMFGLPGEAAVVLCTSWVSMAGGAGMALNLFTSGNLSVEHIAILSPAIFLMGAQVQYMGRILGVIGVKGKYIPIMILISIINALISMIIMRVII